ncbi:hypothetical protein HC256_005040 [Beauveria bassiana]|nr:hypothetical protein HC256_005040 [Beauveria bassiana]
MHRMMRSWLACHFAPSHGSRRGFASCKLSAAAACAARYIVLLLLLPPAAAREREQPLDGQEQELQHGVKRKQHHGHDGVKAAHQDAAPGAVFGSNGGERNGVLDARIHGGKVGVDVRLQQRRLFLVAAHGAVERVEFRLDGVAYVLGQDSLLRGLGGLLIAVGLGFVFLSKDGVASRRRVRLEPVQALKYGIDAQAVGGGQRAKWVAVHDALQVQRARLHQLDHVREHAYLGDEDEDGQIVVGDEALRRTAQLRANHVQEKGADERQREARHKGRYFVQKDTGQAQQHNVRRHGASVGEECAGNGGKQGKCQRQTSERRQLPALVGAALRGGFAMRVQD